MALDRRPQRVDVHVGTLEQARNQTVGLFEQREQ